MNLRRKVQIVMMTAALTVSMAAAAGANQYNEVSVKVTFYDLDVQSDEGAKTLYSRLQRASRRACDVRQRGVSLRDIADARRCYAESLSAAVEKIDSDALHRLHKS